MDAGLIVYQTLIDLMAAADTGGATLSETLGQYVPMQYLPLVLIGVAAAVSWGLAKVFANSLRMQEINHRLFICILPVALGLLVIATMWPPKFGVDLRGGINYIGQLDLEKFLSEDQARTGVRPPKPEEIIPYLRRRVDPSGTMEIIIRPLGEDKIEVIMPDVDMAEADQIWNRLAQVGHLQFRIVADIRFHSVEMTRATNQLDAGNRSRNVTVERDGGNVVIGKWYELARLRNDDQPGSLLEAPFKYVPSGLNLVRDRETGRLIDMQTFPYGGRKNSGALFAQWLKQQDVRYPQIFMIEPGPDGATDVQGVDLASVMPSVDDVGRNCVVFTMKSDGAKKMWQLTNRNKPRSESEKFQLGIILDEELHSAPEINSPISSNGTIEGNFTEREVQDLKVNLDSGKISVALVKTPVSKQYIESTLGAELKNKGLFSIGISLIGVLVFMLFYYRLFAGSVSCLALFLNIILTLALVMAVQQPLTLTGLAGLVLTIGMSVDANVLVFERIREELNKGASLRAGINAGFDRAFGTIIDSNLTTLMTAIVLYVLGTDQVKGFAVTLIIGICTSMFTAVYVSRTLFDIAERKNWLKQLSMANLLPRFIMDFTSKARIAIIVSLITIVVGLVAMVTLGQRLLDIDLRGGSTAQMVLKDSMKREDIEKRLREARIEHRGEPVDFVVSEMRETDGASGTVFKIDSSIDTWDESKGEPKWKELDEYLSEVFQDKIVQRKVTYDPAGIQVAPVDEKGASDVGQVSPEKGAGSSRLSLRATTGNGLMSVQDEAPTVSGGGQESESSRTESDQDGGAASAQAEEAQAGKEGAGEGAESGNNDSAESGQSGGGSEADVADNASSYKATVTLNFDNPVSGKSIRTQLAEVARSIDRVVEESRIVVTSANLPEGQSAETSSLSSWDVTMTTPGKDDAQAILAAWSEGFNKLAYFKTSSGVGEQVAGDAKLQAMIAVLVALFLIILYVWFRFQNIAFGIAAVVALIHDVLVVLGALALSHYLADYLGFLKVEKFKISLQIIAALLTVIGYSLNDTIVIFDRIREVRGKRLELTNDIINTSVSQTLSRTILTSLTTLLVVVVLYFVGGSAIHPFAFALLIGVITGTYSTVFIASPVLVWLMNRFGLNAELNAELEAAQG